MQLGRGSHIQTGVCRERLFSPDPDSKIRSAPHQMNCCDMQAEFNDKAFQVVIEKAMIDAMYCAETGTKKVPSRRWTRRTAPS